MIDKHLNFFIRYKKHNNVKINLGGKVMSLYERIITNLKVLPGAPFFYLGMILSYILGVLHEITGGAFSEEIVAFPLVFLSYVGSLFFIP